MKSVYVQKNGISIGEGNPLVLIAGTCAIEKDVTYQVAESLKGITTALEVPFIFKASFDKANRTSHLSYRGIGMEDGLALLKQIRDEFQMPVLTDVHETGQVRAVAQVVDILQVPAFLCRQTELIKAIARTGKPMNIKKGQFMAPENMEYAARKATGDYPVILTERGSCFGYDDLVVDFRNIQIMRYFRPVLFDATHSVQKPGAGEGCSSGNPDFIFALARAAVAAGVDGIYLEVHPDPKSAKCDGANSLKLDDVPRLLEQLLKIRNALNE